MPTLIDYEKFFDSIGIDERRRTIVAAAQAPDIPKHGNDLPSEWMAFTFANQITILAGPEESAWLQTICQVQPESVVVPDDASGVTHFCAMPGRKLWFATTEDPVQND